MSDTGVYYLVKFSEGSYYFTGFPSYLSVFEFSISVINLGENLTPPLDYRVEATVVTILKTFLSNHENSILYICETRDNKQQARYRKFDTWFNQNLLTIPELEKHDAYITYEDLEVLSSLIIHKENPFKDELVKLFFDQANEYGKA